MNCGGKFFKIKNPFRRSINSSKTFVASSFTSTKDMDYTTTVGSSEHRKDALDFIDFLNASPSPFHCVHEASVRLEKSGFQKISEKDQWNLKRNGKYYFTRNGSSIVAFVVGGAYEPGKGGFSIVGAHTDSPCLKVKPVSKKESVGYLEVGVQLYGGGLW